MNPASTEPIAWLDGTPHPVLPGDTILKFADRHRGRGHIPTLCDAPQLEPYGACRVCSVEVALQADTATVSPLRQAICEDTTIDCQSSADCAFAKACQGADLDAWVAFGEISTRSRPFCRANRSAWGGGMMPNCCPASSITRISRTRIRSLIRRRSSRRVGRERSKAIGILQRQSR